MHRDLRGVSSLADTDPALARLAEGARATATGQVKGWVHVDVDLYHRPGDPPELHAQLDHGRARWVRLQD